MTTGRGKRRVNGATGYGAMHELGLCDGLQVLRKGVLQRSGVVDPVVLVICTVGRLGFASGRGMALVANCVLVVYGII